MHSFTICKCSLHCTTYWPCVFSSVLACMRGTSLCTILPTLARVWIHTCPSNLAALQQPCYNDSSQVPSSYILTFLGLTCYLFPIKLHEIHVINFKNAFPFSLAWVTSLQDTKYFKPQQQPYPHKLMDTYGKQMKILIPCCTFFNIKYLSQVSPYSYCLDVLL